MQAVDELLKSRDQIYKRLKENLEAARQRMKKYANFHKTERVFEVGDLVYLRPQPYRQHSVVMRSLKLSPRFYRPYRILQDRTSSL